MWFGIRLDDLVESSQKSRSLFMSGVLLLLLKSVNVISRFGFITESYNHISYQFPISISFIMYHYHWSYYIIYQCFSTTVQLLVFTSRSWEVFHLCNPETYGVLSSNGWIHGYIVFYGLYSIVVVCLSTVVNVGSYFRAWTSSVPSWFCCVLCTPFLVTRIVHAAVHSSRL